MGFEMTDNLHKLINELAAGRSITSFDIRTNSDDDLFIDLFKDQLNLREVLAYRTTNIDSFVEKYLSHETFDNLFHIAKINHKPGLAMYLIDKYPEKSFEIISSMYSVLQYSNKTSIDQLPFEKNIYNGNLKQLRDLNYSNYEVNGDLLWNRIKSLEPTTNDIEVIILRIFNTNKKILNSIHMNKLLIYKNDYSYEFLRITKKYYFQDLFKYTILKRDDLTQIQKYELEIIF